MGRGTAPISVLVVEDEVDIADVLGTVLSTEGYDVVYASNGEEGLAALDQRPDLVLVGDLLLRFGRPATAPI